MDDGQREALRSCGISAVAKPSESPRGEPRQNKSGPPRFRISSSAGAAPDQIPPGLCLCNPPARYPRRPASLRAQNVNVGHRMGHHSSGK